VSIYDASGRAIYFDDGTPLIPNYIVRVRGDPTNYGRFRKFVKI